MPSVYPRFPVDIAYGAKFHVKYRTNVFEAQSGHEQRNIVWEEPRLYADVSTGIQDQEDLDKLIAFFRKMKGRAYTFRFKDWSDYRVVNQKIGTGDGSTTTFQVIKEYPVEGGTPTVRNIKFLVDGTVKNVTVGGVPQVEGTDFTVDYDAGTITFTTPPPTGSDIIVGEAEFDILCRFDTDDLEISLDAYRLGVAPAVNVIEVRTT